MTTEFEKDCISGTVQLDHNNKIHIIGHFVDPVTLEISKRADFDIQSNTVSNELPLEIESYETLFGLIGKQVMVCIDRESRILEVYVDGEKSPQVFSNIDFWQD